MKLLHLQKFGSNLDEETQQILNRGSRLTEILKQDQFSPLSVTKQVLMIFSGVFGFLDRLELSQIQDFEKRLFNFIDESVLFSVIGRELLDKTILASVIAVVVKKYFDK